MRLRKSDIGKRFKLRDSDLTVEILSIRGHGRWRRAHCLVGKSRGWITLFPNDLERIPQPRTENQT